MPLRVVPDAAYRFRHALTHEVASAPCCGRTGVSCICPGVARLESGTAQRGGADAVVEFLALPRDRAEAWEAAADYGRRAGMKAAARSANRDAVSLYGQALAALRRLPESPARGGAEVDLLLEIRNALFVLGEPEAIPDCLEPGRAHRRGDRGRAAPGAGWAAAVWPVLAEWRASRGGGGGRPGR